jgi:uncharacterized protein (TIGR02588 family)
MTEKDKNTKNKKDSASVPILEWIVAALGLVLVASAVGFMIYRGLTKTNSLPKIKIEVESIVPSDEKYLVTFRVRNEGDLEAAALTIEGELKNGEQSAESSDVTIDYVPSQSEKRGGLIFTKDPRAFKLEIRPKGYVQP